jgi:hypothetical protein
VPCVETEERCEVEANEANGGGEERGCVGEHCVV